MSDEQPAMTEERGRAGGCWRAIGVALRLVFVILLGALLGAGAFLGAPAVYQGLVAPIQENSERVAALEATIQRLQDEERRRAAQRGEQLAATERRLIEQQSTLEGLQVQFESLAADVEALQSTSPEIRRLQQRIDALAEELSQTEQVLEAFREEVGQQGPPVATLERRLQLVRAMELLTRARLWLTRDNLGLASDDVEAAREIVQALVQTAPDDEVEELEAIRDRLDLALGVIRTSPQLAEDDLEVAWQLLLAATAFEPEG